MKVNQKILSIPPFISTCWTHVKTLHTKGTNLVVTLFDETVIEIPGLPQPVIDFIFQTHASVLEKTSDFSVLGDAALPPFLDRSAMLPEQQRLKPLHFAFGPMEGMSNPMQHNPMQANIPDLPKELLEKIIAITKIFAIDAPAFLKAEEGCNCVHCQIAKAINGEMSNEELLSAEEVVADEELTFEQWAITNMGNELYTVVNKLDPNESYRVFLGKPVGCTCGKEGCEHIVAVLKT